MTGHSTCMYSLVPVCVVHQPSWLANGSWRLAHSSDNVLFGDASHCLLMTDCGGYTYFCIVIIFTAPYGCMVQYLVITKRYISFFILIYLVANGYIVNKTLKCMGAQPPEIEQHKGRPKVSERRGQGSPSQTCTRGLSIRRTSEYSWARGGSGGFATSSSHSVKNSLDYS